MSDKPAPAMVHKMCDYLTTSMVGCRKCPARIQTPYGEGEPGCYAVAEETLVQANGILAHGAHMQLKTVQPFIRHKLMCDSLETEYRGQQNPNDRKPCNCGLAEALGKPCWS